MSTSIVLDYRSVTPIIEQKFCSRLQVIESKKKFKTMFFFLKQRCFFAPNKNKKFKFFFGIFDQVILCSIKQGRFFELANN